MISVIVPYRNAENWVGRCFQSLYNQQGDFEFIFVNDNSTDGGKEMVTLYTGNDDRFIAIDNHHHIGVSGARNTGIENASGKWITFLDADDEMLPDAYKLFTKELETDANIHQFNHLRYYTVKDRLVLKYANLSGWYDTSALCDMWFCVWNKLFRADFIKDIRFNERLQYGEDGLFMLECLARDERIHHADLRETTVKHRFDNKQSLSHIKTAADLVKQADVYESFMKHQDGKMKAVACSELSKVWEKAAEEYGL